MIDSQVFLPLERVNEEMSIFKTNKYSRRLSGVWLR